MKLREFLKEMGKLCTDDKILGARIGLSAILDFDHELKDPCSAFAFKSCDKNDPLKRMEHLFAWKYLPEVDRRKAERCEDLVTLLSLYSYKKKYETEVYDEPIEVMTADIQANPIPEIDSQLPLDTVVVMGTWLD
jgi:hypothetical protein